MNNKYLTKKEFDALPEYTLSFPTEVTAGKQWKRYAYGQWLLGTYLDDFGTTSWETITIEDPEFIPLKKLMQDYLPGSHDDWSWQMEILDMFGPSHIQHTIELLQNINKHGIKEPVSLGDDGRVWDGHHRIAIAHVLGLETVPTKKVGNHGEEA